MSEHEEKKMETVSFKTTDSIRKALDGLAAVDEVSRSDFIHHAVAELVKKKTLEARILIDALGIKDL